ncbi:MAG: Mov34/MPN/PAD-1 family protein, partial [Candidatus Altiarchaeota archaeon]|nr:Mov34/MPN/PAD-1 family protein [Candidatus Altiarchaeota archaeon]
PRGVLELILHASRTAYPNEFGGLLRGEGTDIKEVILLPGTIQGDKHAIFRLHMLPIDSKAIGGVHSHPSRNNRPSQADLNFFKKVGNVNLIVAYPYQGITDIQAYDSEGNVIGLVVKEGEREGI